MFPLILGAVDGLPVQLIPRGTMKKNMNKLDEKLRIFGRAISSW